MEIKGFTINDMERFSGIKAHTLRAWEKRYDLLHPNRIANNSRLYTLHDLKKILNIALLKNNGYRISRLGASKEIKEKVRSLKDETNKRQKAINELIINMYHGNPEHFEEILDSFLLAWPMEILIEKIIFPFLKITNLLWIGHQLSEEHLVVYFKR